MGSKPIVARTPEEQELEKKLAELAVVEAELVQSELGLATQTAQLYEFERTYLRIVGTKYAELDRINALIEQLMLKRHPEDIEWRHRAHEAQEKARESAQATNGIAEPTKRESFDPSPDVQRLYRELAKKMHPDLADDPQDRERRNRIMAEVNSAYAEGDIDRLRTLLREWETSPEAVRGEGVAERLVRAIRKIHQARGRLQGIESELAALRDSSLAKLRQTVEDAKREGRDLLAEMASALETEIAAARERLGDLG
jgi:hypothetical protein